MKREAAVVALGMFDGMHMGHRALITRCVRMAGECAAIPAVYSFSNHPQTVLRNEAPPCLTDAAERKALMEELGVRDVQMPRFTAALAALSPEAFVETLLAQWDIRALVVGYNYSFAKYGAGTPETLQALGSAHGFPVEVVPPVAFLEEPVSSTRIRTLIEQGAVRMAAAMLLRPYTLCGTVIRNRQFGREMGFPTANIWPEPGRVLPKDGVYVSEAQVGGERYRAITNVGKNPTVGGERLAVETHLLDFSGDLYGRRLCVSFLEYMRGEQRFDSPADLQKRIAADVETARGYKRT
jgi:riboflavin kinase/FMN adenylyltransferase